MEMTRVLVGAFLLVTACGTTTEPVAQQGPADPAFEAVRPVIARSCGAAGCHDGSSQRAFDSAARFKGSAAKTRIGNGSMPPSGHLPAADKKALLDYLK